MGRVAAVRATQAWLVAFGTLMTAPAGAAVNWYSADGLRDALLLAVAVAVMLRSGT